MQATMEFGLAFEMVPVTPNNNPDYIDYSQLSEIHAGSLVIASNWFCKLYEFLVSKGAQVAILGSQSEHYGFRHFHREFYTVDCDRRQAVRQILDYLYAHGKRRIAIAGCYFHEKMHPVHDAYVEWCQKHGMPELLYNFPGLDETDRNLPSDEISRLFRRDRFDALVFQHHGFHNVSGTIQEVLHLPPEMPVFAIQFRFNDSPELQPFPVCMENAVQQAYEAVKILVQGAQRGTTLTFPCEFQHLPSDWADELKDSVPPTFSKTPKTKE